MTLLRRTPASSSNPNVLVAVSGSKTLHQQNPAVLDWRYRLMQVDLIIAVKTTACCQS